MIANADFQVTPAAQSAINSVKAVPSDYVFIIERSSNLVPVNQQEYVFEGICARFGIVNSNNRLYLKEDYLPHLSY